MVFGIAIAQEEMQYSEKHIVLKENKPLLNRTKAAIPLSTELLGASQKQA